MNNKKNKTTIADIKKTNESLVLENPMIAILKNKGMQVCIYDIAVSYPPLQKEKINWHKKKK